MKTRSAVLILLLVSVLFLAFKLSIANQTEYFTFESYSHLRHASNIKETGIPIIYDELSYQGRNVLTAPLYHYLISQGYEKIITNILIILASILVFFLCRELIKDDTLSLIAAIITLFIPAAMQVSNATLSPIALSLPLFLFFILSYFKFKNWGLYPLMISYILLLLTSSVSIILLLGMLAHLILQKVQSVRPSKKYVEILLFLTFLTLWVFAVTIKDAFASQGIRFIWQNVPTQELFRYYQGFSLTAIFTSIGVLPAILGIVGLNKTLSTKNKNALFVTSLGIVFFLLLLFRMIPFTTALLFLGFLGGILSSIGLKSIKEYFASTRLSLIYRFGVIILILIFSITAIFPSLSTGLSQKDIPTSNYLNALEFVKTDVDGTIISSPKEAHMIMYYSGKRTYYDNNYQFSDATLRHNNAIEIYTGNSPVSQIRLLQEENINYIFLSNETKEFYEIEELNLETSTTCVTRTFDSSVIVYKNECKIK